jgi:hypothetical protein
MRRCRERKTRTSDAQDFASANEEKISIMELRCPAGVSDIGAVAVRKSRPADCVNMRMLAPQREISEQEQDAGA